MQKWLNIIKTRPIYHALRSTVHQGCKTLLHPFCFNGGSCHPPIIFETSRKDSKNTAAWFLQACLDNSFHYLKAKPFNFLQQPK